MKTKVVSYGTKVDNIHYFEFLYYGINFSFYGCEVQTKLELGVCNTLCPVPYACP